jgi:hypothetical protein
VEAAGQHAHADQCGTQDGKRQEARQIGVRGARPPLQHVPDQAEKNPEGRGEARGDEGHPPATKDGGGHSLVGQEQTDDGAGQRHETVGVARPSPSRPSSE